MTTLAELTLGSAFHDVLVELHELLGPCDAAFKAAADIGEGAASAAPSAAASSAESATTTAMTTMHEAVVRDSTAYVHLLYSAGDAAAVVLQPGKAYLVSGEPVTHACQGPLASHAAHAAHACAGRLFST